MPQIETLVKDIEEVLTSGRNTVEELALFNFGEDVRDIVRQNLSLERESSPHDLRMSNIGRPCLRQLQYQRNPKIQGEVFSSSTKLKFLYGHLIEALILLLAKEAGHDVVGQQTELEVAGIKGHRDAIIDGVLVDVKSASSRSFSKFSSHLTSNNDPFGYLSQLGLYHFASRNDPLLVDKERAAFLVVDKQFGHICLDIHNMDTNFDYEEYCRRRQSFTDPLRELAPRGFSDEPEGSSGNRKLGTSCSYCAFKHGCWPGLRTYLYSRGPIFLTQVAREPKVNRYG